MGNWKDYTTKTTVEDKDEIMIADATANANKRTPFSTLWNWIAGKLASAVIAQLETTNKSIIPAINELNSKAKTIAFTVAANKEYSVSLEDNSFYAMTYCEISDGNVKEGTVRCVTIITRQQAGNVGGMHIDTISDRESITLTNSILKIVASNAWLRVHIKKL